MLDGAKDLEDLVRSQLEEIGVPKGEMREACDKLKNRGDFGNLSQGQTITAVHKGEKYQIPLSTLRNHLVRWLYTMAEDIDPRPSNKQIAGAVGYKGGSSVFQAIRREKPDLYIKEIREKKGRPDIQKEESPEEEKARKALINTGLKRQEWKRVYGCLMRHRGGLGGESIVVKVQGEERKLEEIRAAAAHWMYIKEDGGRIDLLEVSYNLNYKDPTAAEKAIEEYNKRLNERLRENQINHSI